MFERIDYRVIRIDGEYAYLQSKRKIASTLTFLGGCFAATNI